MPFKAGPHFWKYPITGHGPNDANNPSQTLAKTQIGPIRLPPMTERYASYRLGISTN
jgi:hypothetical protein